MFESLKYKLDIIFCNINILLCQIEIIFLKKVKNILKPNKSSYLCINQ